MSRLLVKPGRPDADGRVLAISPESAGWRYVGFDLYKLRPDQSLARETGDREACLVLVTGTATIRVDGETFASIGGRISVFDGVPPHSVYVPGGGRFEVVAETDTELAVCTAPAKGGHPARLIRPEDVGFEERGRGTNRRLVYNILPESEPADSLLVVEVVTPGGNWSSYPPHKHDKNNPPHEAPLEEVYYFRTKPAGGSGMIWTYTDPEDKGPDSFNNVFVIEDGDTVLLPKGYHPVVAAPGYELHYTWVLAGEERRYGAWAEDPRFAWVGKS